MDNEQVKTDGGGSGPLPPGADGEGTPSKNGAALITALLFLVIITALGMAAIWTSSTEGMIAANQYRSTQALYAAEAGVQDIMAQLGNQTITPPAYTSGAAYPNWSTTIGTRTIPGTNLSYHAYIKFKPEDNLRNDDFPGSTDNVIGNEVVLYNSAPDNTNGGFGYPSPPCDISYAGKGWPVYTITSVGTVGGLRGASVKLVVDVTSNTINVSSPGGMYSGGCPTFNGNNTISGGSDPGLVEGTSGCPMPNHSSSITGSTGSLASVQPQDLSQYLLGGSGIDQIQQFVTYPAPLLNNPNGSLTAISFSSSNIPQTEYYGTQDTTPAVIFINLSSYGSTNLTLHVSNIVGYGVLVVKGNLSLSGGTNWHGLIYVLPWDSGGLSGNITLGGGGGGVNVTGGLMASGTVINNTLNGGVNIQYNYTTLDNITKQGFKYKIVQWNRVYNP